MAAQLQFFDMSIIPQPSIVYSPLPITLGPNWQPGDIRLSCQMCPQNGTGGAVVVVTPPGFTRIASDPNSNLLNLDVSYRRLQAGDTDTFVQYAAPGQFNSWSGVLLTVRGVSPTSNPTAAFYQPGGTNTASVTIPTVSSTGGTASCGPFSAPGAGAMTLWFNSTVTSGSVGIPAGWTGLVATDSSGANYTPFFGAASTEVVAMAFSSAGSTGTVNLPYGAHNQSVVFLSWIFFPAAADVSAAASGTSETDTSAAATFSSTTTSANTAGSTSETDTSGTAFNALQGYWISDPLTLPGDPVTGSVIRWAGNTPAGSTAVVETSINNGASWDLATVNRPVPRLQSGDTVTRSVLARVSLTRTLATDPAPTMSYLELQVSTDSGVDELVPIGHGMIDKVTVKAVAGDSGSGSTTSGVTSTAVTSKNGGQTGGGTSITVHVTDLSRAIKRNVWQQPFTVPSGLNYGQAAVAMVKNRLPSQTDFSIASTTRLTPLLVFGMDQGGDPWQDIAELAQAIGFEAFFDPKGVFVFRPVPDPRQGVPVWTFDENANPIVAEASRELSDEQTFNDVIVAGQSSSSQNPVTAEAFDNDPSSPTYILGPYGRVTQRLTFSQIITQSQAQDAANATLYNSLGAADTVTITVVPHPALEPGDVVKINVSNVNANGTYMINSMVTPLSPAEAQQLVCFRQSTNT